MRRRWPLLLLGLVLGCGRPEPWNVLVVTFDTTRADFLGCYGKESARTPNLDRLAAEGTLFLEAYSAVPITLPSHSTLFTGTYPIVHGVRDNGLFRLPQERVTLAEILKEQGYATGGAIGAFPLTRDFGIAQGIDFFDDHITIATEDFRGNPLEDPGHLFFDERPAARVNDAILPWLREHADGPFFAWIHYWDPHHPHIPPAPFDQLYAHDLYQGEIAYADRNLGVVLRELRELGAWERTLVVVVGDHGEGRGEHGEDTHSMLTYNSTLRVPLILRSPGGSPGRVAERVGTVDVLPTVLELLGLDAPGEIQGRSLVPLIAAPERPASGREMYYAESLSPRLSHGWGEQRALFHGGWKYVHGPRSELYDLAKDPGELHDLAAEQPEEAERMHGLLEGFLARAASTAATDAVHELDEESRRRLAALGYVSSSGAAPETVREELRTGGTAPQDRIGDVNLSSQIKQHVERRRYLTAKEIGVELVARDPGNAYYRGMLALAYVGLGQIDNAARVVEEAENIAANNDAIFLSVAQRLFAGGSEQRGADIARRLVAAHPTAYGKYLLAEMRWRQGDGAARQRLLGESLEIDPRFDRARLSLAIHLAESGRIEPAEAELKRLLADHPLSFRGHLNYGLLLLKSERWDAGMRHVQRAIELRPDYWRAHLTLLAAYLDLDRRDEAARVLERLRSRCEDPRVLAQARRLMAAPS